MGYDLHITRKEYWADDEGAQISLEEWCAYARKDADLTPDLENPSPKNWCIASHPQAWRLWWSRGEVNTKSPDAAAIAKMVSIANVLKARVLGDDNEIYGVNPWDPTEVARR